MAETTKVKVELLRHETAHELLVRLEDVPDKLIDAYPNPAMSVSLAIGGVSDRRNATSDLVREASEFASIASRPRRRPFEVLLEVGTPLALALAKAGRGATVELGTPVGHPVPIFEHRRHDLFLIGRGVGMGAVRAAVLHAMTERGAFQSVTVIAEASYTDEIPFRDEIPAWQRAGIVVQQILSRPDAGKWRDGEAAYVAEFLATQPIDAAKCVALIAGPDDLVESVTTALRRLEVAPDSVYVFERGAQRRQHRDREARPAELLAKISREGTWGSGHQDDAADHPPVIARPNAQPTPTGMPRYKRASAP